MPFILILSYNMQGRKNKKQKQNMNLRRPHASIPAKAEAPRTTRWRICSACNLDSVMLLDLGCWDLRSWFGVSFYLAKGSAGLQPSEESLLYKNGTQPPASLSPERCILDPTYRRTKTPKVLAAFLLEFVEIREEHNTGIPDSKVYLLPYIVASIFFSILTI